MKRPIELVASYWSIAGNCYASGPTEVSPFDFRDRVETAHKVGYRGVGLVHADIMSVSNRIGFKTMKQILDDNDMKYVEVEIISDWFTNGEKRKRSDKVRADLLRAAEQLGAWHIKIGGDIDTLRRLYGALLHKGVEVVKITDHEIGKGVYFNDPDGNRLEFFLETDHDDERAKERFKASGAPSRSITLDPL